MKFCKNCVMPETKPDLRLNEDGICNACVSFMNRKSIDWTERKRTLIDILERYRSKGAERWDCIVPVSGGKDSTYQVIKMLELGMNPLCVTATTCHLSEVGRRNIENLKRLGVDHLEFSPNPNVRKKLNRIGLRQVGDISWPEHVGIFTIPVRASIQFNIPLIIWGENSQNEYGGPAASAENNVLDRRWLEEFGGLLGLRVTDMVGQEGIEPKHLIPYTYPTDEELKRVGTTGLFLGHYLPWDGFSNFMIAQAHGFETTPTAVETTFLPYENLDNCQAGIHDYFKFLKFGFSRATDMSCLHLRRGRVTRPEACEIVRLRDGKFPWSYLGVPLKDILDPLEISIDEFEKICDKFTNKRLFKVDARGNLVKDAQHNLIKLYHPDGSPD